MAVILRQRRDTAANWASNNPVIPDGQLCFDTTNNTYRIGDGVTAYESLPIQSGTTGNGIESIVRTSGDGSAGTTDTYTITYTDTTTDTFTVVNGADGADGADGITPHIGLNGNWYIGTTDTGIKAVGTDGADGADGEVTLSTAQTVSNKTLGLSSYTQIADASLDTGTHVFDYSAGDMQQLTATGDITIAFSNFVTGKVCTMIIDAVNWGDYIITHPAAMLFAAGTAPTYTAGGTDRLMVVKDKDDIYSLFIVGQAVGVVV